MRLIGALIMTHSDNDGLILPPRVAPVKAVIIPISTDENKFDEEIVPKAKELQIMLNKVLCGRFVKVDTQRHLRPGDRFFYHLQRGVPLRLELGEKEFVTGKVKIVRRDTGEKIDVNWEDLEKRIPDLLDEIQKNIFDKALKFRKDNTHQATSMAEFKEVLESKGGFIEVFFEGTKEDEKAIKEATGATPRCYALEDYEQRGKCFYTGKEGARKAIFAKAY